MTGQTFDLQAHSHHSDGALDPSEVVRRAGAAGIRLLALTDHDTVAGVEEALAAAPAAGVQLVPAVEISAVDDGHEDLHILGYGIDHRAPRFLDTLKVFRDDRGRRAERMAAALTELGFHLDTSELDARRASGGSIGRPHLARAVFNDQRNRPRLMAEGLDRPEQVLEAYLLPGGPAYRGRTVPTVSEAIDGIHQAGGVAVWAHPFWDIDDPAEVVRKLGEFAAAGIDGVETFYVTHTAEQTRLLDAEGERLGLLSTGSSDFHGPDHSLFSRFGAFELHGLAPRLGPTIGG